MDEKQWVNVAFDQDLLDVLDRMVKEDMSDRSKFIRKLVYQEDQRRQVTGGGKYEKNVR